jgi:hypothetical protein
MESIRKRRTSEMSKPSRYLMLLIWTLIAAGAVADEREDAAGVAALEWLTALDRGQYEVTWNEAAPLFKVQVDKEQWVKTASGVREPLGKLHSRTLKSATYSTNLPGAPDGEYVVLQFDSSFANKASAVETITPMLADGVWRVSGYFVR